MGILSSIKKGARKLFGGDDKQKKMKPTPGMGPAGMGSAEDAVARVAERKRKRGRGRDSTIITAGTDVGSRTLLG
jgi:hypothetical protein